MKRPGLRPGDVMVVNEDRLGKWSGRVIGIRLGTPPAASVLSTWIPPFSEFEVPTDRPFFVTAMTPNSVRDRLPRGMRPTRNYIVLLDTITGDEFMVKREHMMRLE